MLLTSKFTKRWITPLAVAFSAIIAPSKKAKKADVRARIAATLEAAYVVQK